MQPISDQASFFFDGERKSNAGKVGWACDRRSASHQKRSSRLSSSLRSAFRGTRERQPVQKRHPGEVGVSLLVPAQRQRCERRRRDGRFLRAAQRRTHRLDGIGKERKTMYVLQLSSKNTSLTTSAHTACPPPRKDTDVLSWLSAAVGSCAYPSRFSMLASDANVRSREH